MVVVVGGGVEGGRTAGSSGGQLASRAVGIQAHKNRRAVSACEGEGNERWYEWCGRLMGGDWERERERAAASAYHALRASTSEQRAVRLCAASGRRARAATLAAGLSAGRLDSCALMDLASSHSLPHTYLTLMLDKRNACRLVADGSHALGSGSEGDGLAVKHRHTHTSRAGPWTSWL